eukprot:symbB.v1.2.002085.t1/scaffold109.1/size325261/3
MTRFRHQVPTHQCRNGVLVKVESNYVHQMATELERRRNSSAEGWHKRYHRNAAAIVNVLIIVNKDDVPIYEADLSTEGLREDSPHLDQFVVHAALDLVDEMVWSTSSMFLRVVDKFNDFHVSAYCTAGHVRMMLLHKHRNEEAIRAFFADVHDLFLKAMLSPFQTPDTRIQSPIFDQKVRAAGQKHFRAA